MIMIGVPTTDPDKVVIPRWGNYHPMDKLTVQGEQFQLKIKSTAEDWGKLLKKESIMDVLDFEITIPIQLFKTQQKTETDISILCLV